MLILTRKPGESIIIGDNVSVVLLGMQHNQVRLGITAPMEITVHRDEIYNKIQSGKRKTTVENATVIDETDNK